MEFNIDSVKLRECGKDIMNLSNEMNETLESLFNRFDNILIKTHEWSGESAIKFVQKINDEKNNYYDVKNTLFEYGKYLETVADAIEKKVNFNKYGG